MAIDVDTETILTIPEACRSIPPRGVSLATFARWLQRGVGPLRIKPESIVIGGRRLVSKESLTRFFAAQNATETPGPSITPTQRQQQAATADRLLQEAGL